MFNVRAENDYGRSIVFKGNNLFEITSIDGLSQSKADFASETIPSIDGAVLTSSRLEVRNIVFTIELKSYNSTSRDILNSVFITKKPIHLKLDKYSIDGEVEDVNYNPFSEKIIAQVSILCFDPYFVKRIFICFDLTVVFAHF